MCCVGALCLKCLTVAGNAAIILRSRLKVKVVKGMFQRTEHEENGTVPHNHINNEAGKISLQLQVTHQSTNKPHENVKLYMKRVEEMVEDLFTCFKLQADLEWAEMTL